MRTDGQTDRQTDMTKLSASSNNFARAPDSDYFPIHVNLMVFIAKKECVYCEVQTEYLYIINLIVVFLSLINFLHLGGGELGLSVRFQPLSYSFSKFLVCDLKL
jgi:hypothetical protein